MLIVGLLYFIHYHSISLLHGSAIVNVFATVAYHLSCYISSLSICVDFFIWLAFDKVQRFTGALLRRERSELRKSRLTRHFITNVRTDYQSVYSDKSLFLFFFFYTKV